ncbi:GntR family transcriptional regulator [Arthrobacter sp. KBS0703]|jgi:GntR family transcriptional regulator|uniref:GntR family transcriptional regulator n=1 Tax=Bacteria TaxID=2 RepID=UPI000990324A|nr:GntR family transcriptional regulator [Arthrobacter sp. KBS0703]TSE17358.1 GntR family transcriptional regulator [Arthrobacter sp. KBS0703]
METPAAAALPKYYVLKEQILTLIEDAVPGTLIPTERALAEQYGTSRTTVRQAIGELVAEGRLDRTQGRGTFVAPPKVTHVRQLTSFTDDAASQGMTASARILDISEVPADTVTAKRLAVEPGTGVHRVERIRLVNGEPLAHETAFLAGDLPDLAGKVEARGSLYSALREDYGIRISEVEDTVETKLAGPEEVRLLDVEMGAPMLLVHRLGLDPDGRAVEWTESVFRGDRFRFVARMHV